MPLESPDLKNPAKYFPPDRGRYDVKPGLLPFGKDFGNGPADGHLFQFDNTYSTYRAVKERVRKTDFVEYVQTSDLPTHIRARVAAYMSSRLATEHPELFALDNEGEHAALRCRLTGETVPLNSDGELVELHGQSVTTAPPYLDAIDAIACQIQEDIAVITADNFGERLTAIHLCFPNHWSAKQKIGNSFTIAHQPVAGIEPITARSSEFVRLMINATQGLVRFAWGITFDDRLDHHPDKAHGFASFDPMSLQAFLRVERQTIWGLPDVNSSLFTIRTYLTDVATLRGSLQGHLLAEALETMSPESRRYKGLETAADILAASLR